MSRVTYLVVEKETWHREGAAGAFAQPAVLFHANASLAEQSARKT